ncbi:MAG: hypothetical protein LBK95_11485 [Bifidobacteriaceae bacterium]|jgi:hypothetical protein|nr:hypothetical protein [Bifidobacteriaceae bacterium]
MSGEQSVPSSQVDADGEPPLDPDDQESSPAAASAAYVRFATSSEYPELLRRAGKRFGQRGAFKIGDLVQWKPDMRQYQYPGVNCPAIVVDPPDHAGGATIEGVLAPQDEQGPTIDFRRPDDSLYEDIFVGFLDEDRIFRVFKVPSRRLEPWRAAAA